MLHPRRSPLFLLVPGLALLCLALSGPANADDSDKVARNWYRYTDAQGKVTLSDQISEAHIRLGYDILDRNMLIVRHIPAFDEALYLKDKVKRDALIRQQEEDARLLRLYTSARDAELARNRQSDALESSMGYNKMQLVRLKSLRANAVEDAAISERGGSKVSAAIQKQVAEYDQQILKLQTVLVGQATELQEINTRFAPIIRRLEQIEKDTEQRNQDALKKGGTVQVVAR